MLNNGSLRDTTQAIRPWYIGGGAQGRE